MSTAEIIEAGTETGAAAAGRSATLGTLEPGKLADMIVIAHSPMHDIEELRNVRLVVRGGEVLEGRARDH